MKKHSSAPWKRKEWSISNVYGDEICQILSCNSSGYTGNDTDEDEANANLIAAAPLLYEAMQKAVDEEGIDDLGQLCIGTSNTADILSALKIARGEELINIH